jgi:hypothetical protein
MDLIINEHQADGTLKYVLVMGDVFSRRCWLRALTTKRSKGSEAALMAARTTYRFIREVFDQHKFKYVLSDQGTEFMAKVTQMFKDEGTTHILARTFTGGVRFVESLNGQVRRMLARTKANSDRTGTWRWGQALSKVEDELNSTPHTGYKLPPQQVWEKAREGRPGYDEDLYQYVLAANLRQSQKTVETSSERLGAPLKPGDRVRIALTALSSQARKEAKAKGGPFAKPSERANWTRAIFTVKSASKGTVHAQRRYMIHGLGRLHIYQHETQRVRADVSKVRADERPPSGLTVALDKLTAQDLKEMLTDGKSIDEPARRWLGARLQDAQGKTGTVVGYFKAEGDDPDEDGYVPPSFGVRVGNSTYEASLQDMLEYLSAEQPDERKKAAYAAEGAEVAAAEKKAAAEAEALSEAAKAKKTAEALLKQQVQQQKKAAKAQTQKQAKAASLTGRKLEYPVAPGKTWSKFKNSTSKTIVLKGTVRADQRSINWRAPALFKGVQVEKGDSKDEVQRFVDKWGV